jgi:2-polyprenyl-6-hydroxyphenyl methylase/3-demethylubiquinone-9 3-methyltransferase
LASRTKSDGMSAASVDRDEIKYFDGLAARWWDERGPFAALQAMTPARVRYITQHAARLLGRPPENPLQDLEILDIGCGGGLLAEPLARLGGKVTGIDASDGAIRAAKDHTMRAGLDINYQAVTAEDFAETGVRFDIIIASEVIEHVQSRSEFLGTVVRFGHDDRPSMAVLTTINRSLPGVVLAKYAAEYVLKLAPRGTHDPRKFVRPSELKAEAAQAGIIIDDVTGIRPSLRDGFTLGGGPLINYAVSGLLQYR